MTRLIALVFALFSPTALAQPDTIYRNANVHTANPDRPRVSAFAVENNRFTASGSDTEVLKLAGPGTRVVDLEGQTVLPGLIDAHAHLFGLGSVATGVIDLSRTRSYEEVVEEVRAVARETPPGEWIIGRGWDHESWASKQLPEHGLLSDGVPDHPVYLQRVDGHAGLANERAMQLAGVTRESEAPAGGDMLRNRDNAPTGVFVDNAETLVTRAIPQSAYGDPETMLLAAQEMCLSAGLTGVHDAGMAPDEIALVRKLEADGRLKLRINIMVSAAYAPQWFEQNGLVTTDRVTVRSAKVYLDGAMGSRGAWLIEPYADRPLDDDGNPYTGLAVTDLASAEQLTKHAVEHGYQVCAHAIGDRANREILDIYERALDGDTSRRFRVEHAQLLHLDDIPRFGSLGVIASMQPKHCTSDMRWVEDRVGAERARGAYAWAGVLRTGGVVASGSDFPVEPHDPFTGFYAAVTRQNEHGEPAGGWLPEERMTRTETLRSFTLDAAYAGFEEGSRGSITPGKLADFVVIDRDVMTVDAPDILNTRVLMTVVGGEVVFEAEGKRQ